MLGRGSALLIYMVLPLTGDVNRKKGPKGKGSLN